MHSEFFSARVITVPGFMVDIGILARIERQTFVLIVLFAFVIIMLIFLAVILFYKNEQKKHRLRNIMLQNELNKRNNDLHQQALKMIYLNNGLAEVEECLKKMRSDSPADIQHVLSALHINRSLEKEWDNFNEYFGHLHVGFFEKLHADFPQLTIADKRLAGLIRMNLTNREIAGILNIEDSSVKTAKYRLKKKLNLKDEQSLYTFLSNLPLRSSFKSDEMEKLDTANDK